MDRNDLHGEYELSFSKDLKEYIVLSKDSTYQYSVVEKGVVVFENSGKWSFSSKMNNISFFGFKFYGDSYSGEWKAAVISNEKYIGILYSSEDNVFYSKAKYIVRE